MIDDKSWNNTLEKCLRRDWKKAGSADVIPVEFFRGF